MKKQRTCIFCGRKGNISKEHFWPEWLGQYFPKGSDDRYISEFHESESKAPIRLQKRTERQGNVITKKIRVVCRECNNGWMSILEAKVKPIIAGFLTGSNFILTKDHVNDLSLWATVKSIVGEHAEEHMVLTPSVDRYLVYKDYAIPDYFRVFVGIHSSETKAAYLRHSSTLSLTLAGPDPPMLRDTQRNTHTVSFLVGPILLHVVAVRVANFKFVDEIFSVGELVRLWPPAVEEIDLLSLKVIDDDGLRIIASKLGNLMSSARVMHAGPLPANGRIQEDLQ